MHIYRNKYRKESGVAYRNVHGTNWNACLGHMVIEM